MAEEKQLHVSSMTGFSSINTLLPLTTQKETDAEQQMSQVSISIKTLNARFFELNCKLPPALNYLETELLKLFKQKFKRGTVYFHLYIHNSNAVTRTIKPSLSVIKQYAEAIHTIQDSIPMSGSLTIDNLLTLPDVFETPEAPLDQTSISMLKEKLEQVSDAVVQARLEEGAKLAQDVLAGIDRIKTHFAQIEPRYEEVRQKRKTSLFQTLDAIPETDEPEGNQAREAQVYYIQNQLDKMDIHEELVRFQVHIEKLVKTLYSTEPEKGKKMDFTLQELFREINTISAKSSDAALSNVVIDIKVELEKAREQAQNIV